MDRSVTPGEYSRRFAYGAYPKQLQIPVDRADFGTLETLKELCEARIRAILEAAEARRIAAAGSEAQQLGDSYASLTGPFSALAAK